MARRILYLVRHGQYEARRRDTGDLTQRGEAQARLTGQVLRDLPFTRLHHSPLRRASHTADLIAREFEQIEMAPNDALRECIPSIPMRFAGYFAGHHPDLDESQIKTCADTMQMAYEHYFQPVRTSRDDHYELIVCHGNIIRFFVAQVLEIHIDAWANMLINHCGITRIMVDTDGHKYLVSHNDIGHLPEDLRTEN